MRVVSNLDTFPRCIQQILILTIAMYNLQLSTDQFTQTSEPQMSKNSKLFGSKLKRSRWVFGVLGGGRISSKISSHPQYYIQSIMAAASTVTATGGATGVAPPPPSLFQDIISSIFTPGTNTGLIQAMNYSFYALFVTLLGMLWLTSGNLHVCALLALSVGLFVSVKW